MAQESPPALILMDIQLPGMSGIDALGHLRADPRTRDIPVMAVTASAMTHDRQKILAAGFDAYQAKPINVKGFVEAVAAMLARRPRRRLVTAPAKVLVVDDTPQNVKLLADLLSVKGYAVVTAASGPEALDKVEAERPDIVLLDVMMPQMSGYEVCKRIRDNPATGILPVVMVTALDPSQERIKGLEAGADDFLTKPVNHAELLARVRSLVRVKQLYDTVQLQAGQLAE